MTDVLEIWGIWGIFLTSKELQYFFSGIRPHTHRPRHIVGPLLPTVQQRVLPDTSHLFNQYHSIHMPVVAIMELISGNLMDTSDRQDFNTTI